MSLAREVSALYEALAEDIGLCFSVEGDKELARQRLYRARKEHGKIFAELSIFFSPTVENEIWIVKTKAPSDAEDS